MSENDETALLAAAGRGDRRAFERIYVTHKDDLLNVAAAMLGDPAAAEDVLHDVFVAFAGRVGALTLTGSLRAYLLAACVNRSRDVLRRRAKEPVSAETCAQPRSNEPGPVDALARKDEGVRVRAALASLPDGQREVVSLHLYGRLKFREIAESVGVSINTAQSRYRYALAALRKALSDQGVEL